MQLRRQVGRVVRRAKRLVAKPTPPPPPVLPVPVAPRFDRVPDLRPLPPAKYLFIVGAIPRRFGGRTASILNKCRLLKELGGVDSVIVTLNYSSEIDDIAHDLRRRGLLVDGVEVVNLHDYFDGQSAPVGEAIRHPIDEPGMDKIRDPDAEVYRYFENGVYRLYKRFDYQGRLIVRDWFNENRARTRRDEFNTDGRLRRTTYMDLHYNRPRQEIYFRADGTPYMNKWLVVDPVAMLSRVERITMLDEQGRPTEVLHSNVELIQSYFDRLTDGQKTFMTVESRRSDGETLGYRRPHVKQVYVLHNPHVPATGDVSKIRPTYAPLLEHRNEIGAVVFLTGAQRADAEAHYGRQDNFYVIPHPMTHGDPGRFEDRDPNLIVILARLDAQKQLDHAIDMFARVVAAVPEARLEIYGAGPDQRALANQISSLNLTQSIKLAGYTKDPASVYRRAALSVLTSRYEGFGLVLLESLSNGCPAVAYDVRYGPSDIIADGVNGYLVPAGSKDAMAERVVRILRDPVLRRRLSENAREIGANFSEESFVARWSGLFHELDAQGWDSDLQPA